MGDEVKRPEFTVSERRWFHHLISWGLLPLELYCAFSILTKGDGIWQHHLLHFWTWMLVLLMALMWGVCFITPWMNTKAMENMGYDKLLPAHRNRGKTPRYYAGITSDCLTAAMLGASGHIIMALTWATFVVGTVLLVGTLMEQERQKDELLDSINWEEN